MPENPLRSLLLLFFGVAAVSTGAVLIKLCALSPLTVGAYRLTLGLPLFWVWALKTDRSWLNKLTQSDIAWLTLSGLFLGLHFATWILSLSYTSVTSSVVLVTTNPIFVGLGSIVFLKERVSKKLWLGTILAFSGSVLVAYGSPVHSVHAPSPWLGNGLALIGALCMSGYLLIGRRLSATVSTVNYVAFVYAVAALTLWSGALLTSSPISGFSSQQWITLGLLALLPQAVGHTVLNVSLKRLPASVVAVAILAEPVFATLLAIPVLSQYPNLCQMLGGLVVITGVALASKK